MNRQQYLSSLHAMLGSMPENEKADIIYDYEEHFRIGMEQGKSEEEIAQSLGDPRTIAKQFRADYRLKAAEEDTSAGNIVRAVIAAVGLGFFNLVFVLGPFLGLVGVIIGLAAAAVGMAVGGFAALLMVILSPLLSSHLSIDVNLPFAFFVSTGVTSFGLLFMIGVVYLTKYFFMGTVKYLKWNMDIIKK